jgi:hypothetical protein
MLSAMSEFVECQNCGRTFFAENIECPYCKGGAEEPDGESPESGGPGSRRRATPSGGRLFHLFFSSFNVVVAGIALLSLVALRQRPMDAMRAVLGLEATVALVLLIGLAGRRRWARVLAILFILGNAGLGVSALVERGQAQRLAWGPGPLVLLLFLAPFCTQQARDRFTR